MAKNKISEWSSTPANNTDIGGIDIAEGCAPSGINNAIRELMAQVKDQQTGTDADNFTVGGNLTVVGTATGVTPLTSDNSTKFATTAFVQTKVGTLGTISTQNANAVAITGGSITGITDLAVADGGTGASTLSANAVLLGNGTSALQTVAPSTSGNVLTSNGTTWTSATPSISASSFTGSNQSLTSEGYQKLPGGLIIQWGTCSSGVAKTFPIAFTTACLSITATINNTNAEIRVSNVTTTGFTAFTNQNGFNAYFIAIGY